jgi:hypothetical protein
LRDIFDDTGVGELSSGGAMVWKQQGRSESTGVGNIKKVMDIVLTNLYDLINQKK